jgi:hypothetical protein
MKLMEPMGPMDSIESTADVVDIGGRCAWKMVAAWSEFLPLLL